ncbi:AAA domain-containing protein [Melanogaster broomeanus]|nr:AAA domain-containing protein [Melanogaster broomeanus]
MDAQSPASSNSPDPFHGEQTMLILVGLIASGKSTFAEALENHFPRFRRCNQDDLGNRQLVEDLAYETLREGLSPCIDRTNFNALQRSYWTGIAREFLGTSISVIVFHTPYQVCASRLQQRTSHPTIKNVQQGMSVLRKFASDFQLPSPDEGYDHILYLRPSDHPRPEYTRDEVLSILERLKASTRHRGTGDSPHRSQSHIGNRAAYSRSHRTPGYRGGYGYPSAQSQSRSSFTYAPGSSTHRSTGRGRPFGASRIAPRSAGPDSSEWWRSPQAR